MFKYQEAYESLLLRKLKPNSEGQVTTNCIFHDDEHPSLCINLAAGLYKCHGCGKEGNFFTFIKEFRAVSIKAKVDASAMIDKAMELAGIPDHKGLFLTYYSETTCYRYDVENLISVKGGIKVRLSILQDARVVYSNTPNLSSGKSRQQLINKFEKLIGSQCLSLEYDLIEVERRCTEKLKLSDAKKEDKAQIVMSEEDIKEGEAFLKSVGLFDKIKEDIKSLGVAGEENNALLLFLVCVSRILPNPLSVVFKGSSSTGKSHLITKILQMMPPEAVKNYSYLSSKVLAYMDKLSLKNKILVVFEHAGSEASEYNIRIIQSEGILRIAITTKNQSTGQFEAQEREVEGPVSFIESTTKPNIHPENETRVFSMYADESAEQTMNVHVVQKQKYKPEVHVLQEEIRKNIIRKHVNAQRLLKPWRVDIPYVDHIKFPVNRVRSRRDHPRFLALIECVVVMHQYQREHVEKYGQEYLIATLEDYSLAYYLAKNVLTETLLEIPPKSRDLLTICQHFENGFTRKEILRKCGWSLDLIRIFMEPLVVNGYIEALSGGKGQTYKYKVVGTNDFSGIDGKGILSPEELAQTISLEAKSKERNIILKKAIQRVKAGNLRT